MKRVVVSLFILIGLQASAQFPDYFVDLIRGEVFLTQKGAASRKLKYHDYVFKDDSIILKPGAQVTLVNTKNKSISITKSGSYNRADIEKMRSVSNGGVTRIYFTLVWDQIKLKHHAEPDLKKITRSLGGVRRGDNCLTIMMPFNGWVTCADSLKFEWSSSRTGPNYKFRLTGFDNKPILDQIIQDTQFVFRRNMLPQPEDTIYYWEIKEEKYECPNLNKNRLIWLSREQYENISRELIRSVIYSDTRNYNLNVAEVLIINKFYELAAEYILKAYRHTPD